MGTMTYLNLVIIGKYTWSAGSDFWIFGNKKVLKIHFLFGLKVTVKVSSKDSFEALYLQKKNLFIIVSIGWTDIMDTLPEW